MYSIRAILFDLDGVIVDSNPAIESFWKSVTDREGVELTDTAIRTWIHGRKVGDTLAGLFGHLSEERHQEIREAAYQFDLSITPKAVAGVTEFIRQLRDHSLPVGLVTSSHHSRMLNMITQLDIHDRFTHFVTAQDVSKGKPDPEPYLAMSSKMGLDPGDCLVFEDAISGIQSAQNAGMHSIGIGKDWARQDLCLHGAKDVISDFSEIRIHQRTFTTPNGTVFTTVG